MCPLKLDSLLHKSPWSLYSYKLSDGFYLVVKGNSLSLMSRIKVSQKAALSLIRGAWGWDFCLQCKGHPLAVGDWPSGSMTQQLSPPPRHSRAHEVSVEEPGFVSQDCLSLGSVSAESLHQTLAVCVHKTHLNSAFPYQGLGISILLWWFQEGW